jgi:hypothetical protein
MNFMMAWDSRRGVVFLVTGGSDGLVTVWAMRPRKGNGRWQCKPLARRPGCAGKAPDPR